uniref:histone acetyltransferase n=1 Tax=Steinernema glaseri TaxID=37863 RepID=A0A1I7YYN6_9BILA
MGRGRPPLHRERPTPVGSNGRKHISSLAQSSPSSHTMEVKRRGRKRKVRQESAVRGPTNDDDSSPCTSSDSEPYRQTGRAACSRSSISPHRRSDNLLDALSPYFRASAQRRRLHQRGEYALLSGKHQRSKHATPLSSGETPRRGRPCSLYRNVMKARNSRNIKLSVDRNSTITPVSTSMKASKRTFATSSLRAVPAQTVQVQRTSNEAKSVNSYMARFNTPATTQLYKEIHDVFQKQRSSQMDYIIENKGRSLPSAIQIGQHYMKTWYSSPYPQEYVSQPFIFICPYCLHYSMTEDIWNRHAKKCVTNKPPGDEIYRFRNTDETISVFEVDGNVSRIYCQNLCLLSKLFLDSKTLFYDVEPFLFYVLTRVDSNGFHFVGYFSKEKYNTFRYERYHLSCIMTLPCFQRKGYGRFLIDFSYLLARREGKPGTPEKPLSELGDKSFRAYWRTAILQYFASCGCDNGKKSSLKAICEATGMTTHDIKYALKELKFLRKVPGTASHQLSINWCMIDMFKRQETGRKRLVAFDTLLKWMPKTYSLEQDYQIPGTAEAGDQVRNEKEQTERKVPGNRKSTEKKDVKPIENLEAQESRFTEGHHKDNPHKSYKIEAEASNTRKRTKQRADMEGGRNQKRKKVESDNDQKEEVEKSRRVTLRNPRKVFNAPSMFDESSDEERRPIHRCRGQKKSTTNPNDQEYRPTLRSRRSSMRNPQKKDGNPADNDALQNKNAHDFLDRKPEELKDAGGDYVDEHEITSSMPTEPSSKNHQCAETNKTPTPPSPTYEEQQGSTRTNSSLSSETTSARCQSVVEAIGYNLEREDSVTPTEVRPISVQSNQSYTVNMGGDPDDNDMANNSPTDFPGYDEEERHQRSVCKIQPPQTNGIVHQIGITTTEMPNLNSVDSNNGGLAVSDDDIPPTLSPMFSEVQASTPSGEETLITQNDNTQGGNQISRQIDNQSAPLILQQQQVNTNKDDQAPYSVAPVSNGIVKSTWASRDRKDHIVHSTTSPANSSLSITTPEVKNRPDYDHSSFPAPNRPENCKSAGAQGAHQILSQQGPASQQPPSETPKTKAGNRRRNTVGTTSYPAAAAPLQQQYPNFPAVNAIAASPYFPHGNQFAPPNYGYPMYPNANPAQFHQAAGASAIYPTSWPTQAQYATQYNMQKQGMASFPAAYYMTSNVAVPMNGVHQPVNSGATAATNGSAQNFPRYPSIDANAPQPFTQFYNPSYGFMSANMPLNP